MSEALALKLPIASLILCLAAFGQIRPSPIVLKAEADFDKVDAAPMPRIQDTLSCVQSSAAALASVRPEEQYLFQYRKGYCELFGAILNSSSDAFRAAVTDFGEALTSWPKKAPTGPPAALQGLIAIARIEQGRMADTYPEAARDFEAVVADASCPATPIMSVGFCSDVVATARVWLGWLAYRKNDIAKAAQNFGVIPASPWNHWISGRTAQSEKRLSDAATAYQKALDGWSAAQKSPNPDVVMLLGPKPDSAAIYYQLGVMDYESGRFAAAIPRLDAAIKAMPKNSYAIFIRARSKDGLQQYSAALDDYNMAVQLAKMNEDTSWNIGQAYYFRGILFYRLKDFARAESEFSNALASPLTEFPLYDVNAWRAMAAVSGGDCKTSADTLETATETATDQFPKAAAAAMVIDCRLKRASNLEDYLALEKRYAGVLAADKLQDLRNLISSAYADRGAAAEDGRDSEGAIAAYRRRSSGIPLTPRPGSILARFISAPRITSWPKRSIAHWSRPTARTTRRNTGWRCRFWRSVPLRSAWPKRAQFYGARLP
jgi:tetratricopeptide (TPR) repeat protein